MSKLIEEARAELNAAEDALKTVLHAIHDVGKVRVRSEILTKPGKLSELEYRILQEHVQAGYEILKGVEFPWPVAQIVLQHHERLDGSGYPNGLRRTRSRSRLGF